MGASPGEDCRGTAVNRVGCQGVEGAAREEEGTSEGVVGDERSVRGIDRRRDFGADVIRRVEGAVVVADVLGEKWREGGGVGERVRGRGSLDKVLGRLNRGWREGGDAGHGADDDDGEQNLKGDGEGVADLLESEADDAGPDLGEDADVGVDDTDSLRRRIARRCRWGTIRRCVNVLSERLILFFHFFIILLFICLNETL